MMKVGIVGIGAVGAATAMAVVLRARVRELILIDRNRARSKAVATDMHYGVPLSPLVRVADGEYSDLAGAGVTIIAAGVNEKSGGATDRNDPLGRLRLLDANAKVFEDIIPRIVDVAPQTVLLVTTDPPEPLADIARNLAGHNRVVSTSTYLDSLRFRVHLAQRLGVSPSLRGFLRDRRARHLQRVPMVFGARGEHASGGFAHVTWDCIRRVSPGDRA